VLFVVLAAAAVLVHLVVVPLRVAAVWFQPATLLIESQPAGAEVVLDGAKLPSPTPVRLQGAQRSGRARGRLAQAGLLACFPCDPLRPSNRPRAHRGA